MNPIASIRRRLAGLFTTALIASAPATAEQVVPPTPEPRKSRMKQPFNTAQMLLLSIGGTAAGQAFGYTRDNSPSTKKVRAKRKAMRKVSRQYN